jgi:hypothetical protein
MASRNREALQEQFEKDGKTLYVTTQMVDDEILTADYHRFPDTTVTVCCIQLHNGFTTVGKSACANPANFDMQLGRELAYDDAKQKIYTLVAFRLRDVDMS